MALTYTPDPDLGSKAPAFDLPGVDGRRHSFESVAGEHGTLVMFICNHCPYVKAIQDRLVDDARELLALEVARAYGAVCTPDFFGYDADGRLVYRGRLDAAGAEPSRGDLKRDLVDAFRAFVETGEMPAEQYPSMGCSIKWTKG